MTLHSVASECFSLSFSVSGSLSLCLCLSLCVRFSQIDFDADGEVRLNLHYPNTTRISTVAKLEHGKILFSIYSSTASSPSDPKPQKRRNDFVLWRSGAYSGRQPDRRRRRWESRVGGRPPFSSLTPPLPPQPNNTQESRLVKRSQTIYIPPPPPNTHTLFSSPHFGSNVFESDSTIKCPFKTVVTRSPRVFDSALKSNYYLT